jgi:hypothetical protein
MSSTEITFVYKTKQITKRIDAFTRSSDVYSFLDLVFRCGMNLLFCDPDQQNVPVTFSASNPLPRYVVKK